MDLFACSHCGRRFYAPGVGPSESHRSSQCGGDVVLALHGITLIPLDARWLNPRGAPGEVPTATLMSERDRIP
jgi:hypothetical protein